MTNRTDAPKVMLPRPRGRWKTMLLVLLVFISGTVIGGAGTTMFIIHRVQYAVHHPEEIPDRVTARLTRRLSLTSDQADKVRGLIATRMAHLREIHRQVQPEVRGELNGLRADVRGVLTPEQQEKWDRLFDDLVENWLPPLIPAAQPTTAPVRGP